MNKYNCLLSSYALFIELCSDGFFRSNDAPYVTSLCKRRLDLARNYQVIFLVPEEIAHFCAQLPSLISKIFIIVGRSDESFDHRFDFLLDDSRILHVFAQNCDHLDHPKLTPLPLGFENPGWLYSGNPTNDPLLLLQAAKESITQTKEDVILCSFSLMTNVEKRALAMKGLENSLAPVRYYSYPASHSISTQKAFYRAMATSRFVACPHGNGIDSHRLWQSLLMGCIPLTTYNKALEPFRNFGIVFLDSWDDLAVLSAGDLYKLSGAHSQVPLKELSARFWCDVVHNKCLEVINAI